MSPSGGHHVRPVILPPQLVPAVPEAGIAVISSLLRAERIVLIIQDEAEVLVIKDTPRRPC